MLLQGQGVREAFEWLVRFVRCLKTGSSGKLLKSWREQSRMLQRLHTQFGVRRTDTAGQGCHLPLRPSTRADLQASDGHWKGREYCEEPQGAIVAVSAGTREGAGPPVRASAQTRGCDAPTQGRGGPWVRHHGFSRWMYLVVGCRRHQLWTAKKYILGSGHNSLGGPMLDISLARIGTDRSVLSKIYCQIRGDAVWQYHDAVQYFSDSHVGDPSVNTPAETECVCPRSWLCCPCDAASFAKARVAEQEANEGQGRKVTTAPESL